MNTHLCLEDMGHGIKTRSHSKLMLTKVENIEHLERLVISSSTQQHTIGTH